MVRKGNDLRTGSRREMDGCVAAAWRNVKGREGGITSGVGVSSGHPSADKMSDEPDVEVVAELPC